MALTDSNDPNKDFINALTYLGKGPYNIGMPGGAGDISTGAGPAPAPGVNVGLFGRGAEGTAGGGPRGDGGGADILGMIQKGIGATGKSSDFVKKLMSGDPQGMDVLRSMVASGELNLGELGGLQGLGTELPNTTMQAPGEFSDLSQLFGGSLVNPNLDTSGLEGLTTSGALTGTESGAGAAGSLGTGAAGAGALAAILGLIAQGTGSEDLGKAAQALGMAGTGAGIAGSVTGAAAGGIGAANAAGAGLGAAAGAGSSAAGGGLAGAGATIGAAAAPIAGALLFDAIMEAAGGPGIFKSLPGGEDNPTAYQTFGSRLGSNEGAQGTALQTLQQALPYVQSKEELGQLLNTYKNYVGTTTGSPMTGGNPEDLYGIGTIAGMGPVTHGQQTPSMDWGPETQSLQNEVNSLLGVLPGNKITQDYAGGGGLSGEPARRLWEQFLNPGIGPGPEGFSNVGDMSGSMFNLYGGAEGSQYRQVGGADLANAMAAGTIGRSPVWDPATGQFVYVQGGGGPANPRDYFKMAPYLAMLQGGGPGGNLTPEMVNTLSSGTGGPDVWLDWLKQQQGQ